MFPQSKAIIATLVLALATAMAAHAQAPSVPKPSAILQPALSDVQSTTAGLNIPHWKAPGRMRSATQENVDSIQHDLSNTLPGLLAQADAAPDSVAPSFAVYRNVDALYDVLLRVSEAANFSASSEEANALYATLSKLEAARSQLGDAILHISRQHETQLVDLEKAIQAAKAAPPPKAQEFVVDDGPVKSHRTYHHKTTKKKAAAKPAPAKPDTSSTQ
jgi:hypothetical protein